MTRAATHARAGRGGGPGLRHRSRRGGPPAQRRGRAGQRRDNAAVASRTTPTGTASAAATTPTASVIAGATAHPIVSSTTTARAIAHSRTTLRRSILPSSQSRGVGVRVPARRVGLNPDPTAAAVAARVGDRTVRMSWPVRRVLSPCAVAPARVAAIHLRRTSPCASSGLPGSSGGQPSNAPCLALLRVGFTEPCRSPGTLVVSYTTVSPLPPHGPEVVRGRSVLCGTVPRVTPGGCYPPPCPVEPGRSSASLPARRGRLASSSAAPDYPVRGPSGRRLQCGAC